MPKFIVNITATRSFLVEAASRDEVAGLSDDEVEAVGEEIVNDIDSRAEIHDADPDAATDPDARTQQREIDLADMAHRDDVMGFNDGPDY